MTGPWWRAGVELTLVVPATWPEGASSESFADEPFEVIALPVRRPGDVNRAEDFAPDVIGARVMVLYREMLVRRGRPIRITPATGLVS